MGLTAKNLTKFQCRKILLNSWICLFEMISEVSGAWYKSYSEHPTEIVNASAGPGKVMHWLAGDFLWSIFTTFWLFWPLCPLILWLPPPGLAKFPVQTMATSWVFLWPIFATFCHSAVQQKIVSWFENLWKEIRKELKQLFLLMLKFKVSQELDVHLTVLIYVKKVWN